MDKPALLEISILESEKNDKKEDESSRIAFYEYAQAKSKKSLMNI